MTTLGDVLTRYDELAGLLPRSPSRRSSDDDQVRRAAAVLLPRGPSARRRSAGCLALQVHRRCRLVGPLRAGRPPGADQSWFLDDRRRLAERVTWHADPTAWGQHPASTCVRSIGGDRGLGHAPSASSPSSTFTMSSSATGEASRGGPPGPRARRARPAVSVEDPRRAAAGRRPVQPELPAVTVAELPLTGLIRARQRPPPALHRPRAVRARADPGLRRVVVLPRPREPAARRQATSSRRRSAAGPSSSPRDADGEVRAMLNRCRHRGAVVVADAAGAPALHLPVPRLDVRRRRPARRAPVPRQPPLARSPAELGLGRLAVDSYRGFVFATLHPDPEPVTAWLGRGGRGLRRPRRSSPGRSCPVRADAQRVEFRATGSSRGTTPPTASTRRSPTMPTTSSGRPPTSTRCSSATRTPADDGPRARQRAHGRGSAPWHPAGPWATMRPCRSPNRSSPLVADRRRGPLDLATGSMVNLSLFPSLIFVGNQVVVVEPVAVDRTRLTMHLTSRRTRLRRSTSCGSASMRTS